MKMMSKETKTTQYQDCYQNEQVPIISTAFHSSTAAATPAVVVTTTTMMMVVIG
jgi:hypothetical protein